MQEGLFWRGGKTNSGNLQIPWALGLSGCYRFTTRSGPVNILAQELRQGVKSGNDSGSLHCAYEKETEHASKHRDFICRNWIPVALLEGPWKLLLLEYNGISVLHQLTEAAQQHSNRGAELGLSR